MVIRLVIIAVSLTPILASTPSPRDCENQGNFYCDSSRLCLPASQRCNGYSNCYYGEDEAGCASTLPATIAVGPTTLSPRGRCEWQGGFYCASSNYCVSPINRCDGNNNCYYGEDEAGCGRTPPTTTTAGPTTLSPRERCERQGKFYCTWSNDCLLRRYRCDGYNDCYYGEDEVECGTTSRTTTTVGPTTLSQRDRCEWQGKFYCASSSDCILRRYRCDGYNDCSYGEDEVECGTTPRTTTTTYTSSVRDSCLRQGNFYCDYSRQCIPYWYRCDGSYYCSFGEDESGCGSSSYRPHLGTGSRNQLHLGCFILVSGYAASLVFGLSDFAQC